MIVLAVCLSLDGKLPSASAELIGGARRLAARGSGRVAAAVLGSGVNGACRDAGAVGADYVYVVDDPALAEFDSELYLQALRSVADLAKPAAVLLAADVYGAELGPRLAHRLGTGAVTECAGLGISDDGQFIFTRPVYGGHLVAEMAVVDSPCVATIMPGALDALPRDDDRAVEIERVTVQLEEGARRTRVLGVQREEAGAIPLEKARIVVSGGRGLGDAANIRYVEELAAALGAAVGVSRAAVDAGWAPSTMQVGQTGKKVSPDLYLAVGISGATQHVAGMSGSKHVVVINKDPEAPFFRIADIGVAIDYKELLPLLTSQLKARLGKD